MLHQSRNSTHKYGRPIPVSFEASVEVTPLTTCDPISFSVKTLKLQQARLGQKEQQSVANIVRSRIKPASVVDRLVDRRKD